MVVVVLRYDTLKRVQIYSFFLKVEFNKKTLKESLKLEVANNENIPQFFKQFVLKIETFSANKIKQKKNNQGP